MFICVKFIWSLACYQVVNLSNRISGQCTYVCKETTLFWKMSLWWYYEFHSRDCMYIYYILSFLSLYVCIYWYIYIWIPIRSSILPYYSSIFQACRNISFKWTWTWEHRSNSSLLYRFISFNIVCSVPILCFNFNKHIIK